MDTTLGEVLTIVARILKIDIDRIHDCGDLRELPNVDSARVLDIVLQLEDHFGIEFPDEIVLRLNTLYDLVAAVRALRVERERQPLPH